MITEAQIRFRYYRSRIATLFGSAQETVVEIGGGFGGLAVELLRHHSIGRYVLVELPDALPLVQFYTEACLGSVVQTLYRPADRVDPTSRVVLVPPWKLGDVVGPADLMINIASFQHMDMDNLLFYFSHIARLRAKTLYLVNRNRVRDPTDVIIDRYPLPPALRLVSDTRHYLFDTEDVRERAYCYPGVTD